jgi:hypothetical protein
MLMDIYEGARAQRHRTPESLTVALAG